MCAKTKATKKAGSFVKAALAVSLVFLAATDCMAQSKKQKAAVMMASYGDVIARPGESEVVVENSVGSAITVILNGQLLGTVKPRSSHRFVVPDGNHLIKVQNNAKGGGASRDVQFYTQAKRFFFKATSSSPSVVHLARENVYDITVPNAADGQGGAGGDVPISQTALGKDKEEFFGRMDRQMPPPGGPAAPAPAPAPQNRPAPQPAPAAVPAPAAASAPSAAPAQLPGGKIAVYVTGRQNDGEKKAFATKLLVALVNSGKYTAIERSDEFLDKIDDEHAKQRSGSVDDRQISELGRQFGVQYVCIADIVEAFGSFQISARIIDVETAVVLSIGETSSDLRNMNDLSGASYKIVRALLKQ